MTGRLDADLRVALSVVIDRVPVVGKAGGPVLTSVLPGLREVRAPLSAGFLWLLALWFAVERAVPDRRVASGAVASAYRLGEILAAVGWGAAVTFAAYLVGSLSVFLFSGLLRKVMLNRTRSLWTPSRLR